MARIRSVKPQLRTSLTAAEWPREVRYFWVLLWGYLDDHGRGVDDARLIKADCFPLDDDLTRQDIDNWLDMMSKSTVHDDEPAVCRYEIKGRRYLHAPKWTDHQKPQHPKDTEIPPCPVHHGGEPSNGLHEEVMKPSGSPREDLTPEVEVYREVEVEVEKGGGEGAHPPDAPPRKRGTPATKGTRIPEDFTITTEMRAWAHEKVPDLNIDFETIKFVNHFKAKTGQGSTMLRWDLAWQNWMLRAVEFAGGRPPRASPANTHQAYRNPADPSIYEGDL